MRRALVVDDHASNLRLTCAILEGEGWAVEQAMDAEEALSVAGRLGPGGADIVLLDVQMPGRTGLEVLPEIRELLPDVPVVALTAYAMAGDRERFLKAGFAGYIPKPIDVSKFVDQVEQFTTGTAQAAGTSRS